MERVECGFMILRFPWESKAKRQAPSLLFFEALKDRLRGESIDQP